MEVMIREDYSVRRRSAHCIFCIMKNCNYKFKKPNYLKFFFLILLWVFEVAPFPESLVDLKSKPDFSRGIEMYL